MCPTGALPSPPPCGWSTGFITDPLTDGLIPKCLVFPALPNLTFSWSAFPTTPIVALHLANINLISPEGNLTWAYFPSLAINCALCPATLTNFAPWPGFNSMLWINVPTGMFDIGKQLPGLISAFSADITLSPSVNPCGAIM